MSPTVKTTWLVVANALAILILAFAIYAARWPLLIALLGVGTGVLLAPPIRGLHRKLHFPHWVGATLFLILTLALIGGIFYLIAMLVVNELLPMLNQLPQVIHAGTNRLANLLKRFPSFSNGLRNLHWGQLVGGGVQTVFTSLQKGAEAVTLFLYLLAVSLYLGSDSQRYQDGLLTFFPRKHHPRVRIVLDRCARELRMWFLAQLIAMTCVGGLASIGFLIIGLHYWWMLGLLTGVLDIVPFLGPTVAAACAILVTLGSDPSKVTWVLVNYVIVEHIESNIIVPLIMRGRMELPPVTLLTAMIILGAWFGILGVFLAPPLLVVVRAIYLETYVPYINSERVPKENRKSAA